MFGISTENSAFNMVLLGHFLFSLCSLPGVYIIGSPYGLLGNKVKNMLVNGRVSWIMMEIVSPLVYCVSFFSDFTLASNEQNQNSISTTSWVLFLMWNIHYFNRSIVYPLRHGSRARVHIGIPLLAAFFNLMNGYINGRWARYHKEIRMLQLGPYETTGSSNLFYTLGLYASHFALLLGTCLFVFGLVGNMYHDEILMKLRARSSKPSSKTPEGAKLKYQAKVEQNERAYFVPQGGLFSLISCPHYFCELVEWVGYAIACGGLPGWLFVFSTFSNLVPRAQHIHEWYTQKFPNYPKDRKRIFPFIY